MKAQFLPPPVAGINTRDKGAYLKQGQSPYMENMYCDVSIIKKRLGYSSFSKAFGTGKEIGMDLVNFEDGSGTNHLLAFTTNGIYLYNDESGTFVSKNPTIAIGELADWKIVATEASLTFDPESNYFDVFANNAYRKIGYIKQFSSLIDLTPYNTLFFLVKSDLDIQENRFAFVISSHIKGNKTGDYVEVFFDEPYLTVDEWYLYKIPVDFSHLDKAKSIAIYFDGLGSFSVKGIEAVFNFTGDETNRWAYDTVHNAGGWAKQTAIVCSNGIDPPVYWDGVTENFAILPTDVSFYEVIELKEHYNHLGFYNYSTDEATGRFVRNFRWANLNDPLNWTGGTSGEMFLTRSNGALMRTIPLRNNLLLFSTNSILEQRYVGGVQIFQVDTLAVNIGLLSPKFIYVFDQYIMFAGNDRRFYILSTSGGMTVVGDHIRNLFIDKLYFDRLETALCAFRPFRNRGYWFFTETEHDKFPKTFISLNFTLGTNVFEHGRFAHSIMGSAVYENTTSYRCNGDWAVDRRCNDADLIGYKCSMTRFRLGYPEVIFISDTTETFTLDEETGNDGGASIYAEVQTRDITVNEMSEVSYFRPNKLIFNAVNERLPSLETKVYIDYSTDGGKGWSPVPDQYVILNSNWTEHQVEIDDIKTQSIRFKFSTNSKGDFQLGDITFIYNPGTARD